LQVELLRRPLSIKNIRDGGVYALPNIPFTQTNLFLKIGSLDELFVKIPSERGIEDYRKWIKLAESNPLDVRSLEKCEEFEGLNQTLDNLGWQSLAAGLDPEVAHYLAVHKLQYERLRTARSIEIPEAKFGVVQRTRFGLFSRATAALFQERVEGRTLWEMYDFAALRVASRWRPFLPIISAKLSELLNSELVKHIDWNIKNFVFSETTPRLAYVDLKPSIFISKHANEHNLQGIRDYFIQ
jgi:hypothetical protein